MFLKALTIKGFKSFAETAELVLEPGITVVVGPNGSGKSNVVDAIAWVLGAQAPTAVRSAKMDDVIFAGTASRQALGRAEVSLTIDNTDGVLPLDFTEVTITRTLFRSGDSDYAINGVSCRLLDIQDLLSDSGVGRQQHIIVSQGRIDDVLNARPEDRRSVIEEAAGVLKYRRRKERAERRLAATEDGMQRLKDLLREVRRQVKPLEKQADAARRHGTVVAELQTLKIHLAGRELFALRGALATASAQLDDGRARSDALSTDLARLDAVIVEHEAQLSALGASDVADVASRARSLAERIKGTNGVLGERRRRLEGELRNAVDDGLVANLEAEAAQLERDLTEADAAARAMAPRRSELARQEAALEAEQLTFDTEWGDGLDPRPMRAPELRATIEALQRSVAKAAGDRDRLDEAIAGNERRRAQTRERAEAAAATVAETTTTIEALRDAATAATGAREQAEVDREERTTVQQEQQHEASHWQARADALGQALDQARSRAGADALGGSPGVLGVLLDLVDIDPGWEAAVEAAAADALAAVVVDSEANAVTALAALDADDLSGAVLALGLDRGPDGNDPGPSLRSRVRPLRPDVGPLLDALIGRAVVVDGGWREAVATLAGMDADPTRVVVTRRGDRFGPSGWRIGADSTGATGAALEEASGRASFARAALAEATTALDAAREAVRTATTRERAAEADLRAAEQRLAEAQRTVDSAGSGLAQLDDDRAGIELRRSELDGQIAGDERRLSEARAELPAVENEEAEYLKRVEALSRSRTSLADRAKAAAEARRQFDVELAGVEQRRDIVRRRLEETEQRLANLVEQRDRARQRRLGIETAIAEVDRLVERLAGLRERLDGWIALIEAEQRAQSDQARQVSAELGTARQARSTAEQELTGLRERLARVDLEAAEHRVKLESLTEALRRELATEPDVAERTGVPDLPDGVTPAARVRDLERELKLMGPINPLALDEFEALKERHEFLDNQLDDVKKTRRELNSLIRSIDAEIVNVFSAAYADVATNFVELFNRLFPGGKGGVVLTNADDLLNCGIEIEAKPSGKNVKKLSLLSGGERSLVALAFLFAVFRSRPSPFYVMDEVEAALDDVNLTRFLSLLEEFRDEAQLIVVSHQKRTMESADVLYGVSMKPGGSSKVVSEKVEGRAGVDLTAAG
ncbi:MAG: chromosome segregation protein SMC [Acidimicrobiales bacterium]